MKTIITPLLVVLAACAGAIIMSSCEKKGPAEKAGEKIDESIEKAGDKIEKATD